jgi:hypothetical protein
MHSERVSDISIATEFFGLDQLTTMSTTIRTEL